MFLPFAVVIGAVLFCGQLALCFGKAKTILKWLPVLLLAVFGMGCLCLVFADAQWTLLPYGAAFAAYIFAVMAASWLAGLMLAWLVYVVVKVIQKRRK